MQSIVDAYDLDKPTCRFRHLVYNQVEEGMLKERERERERDHFLIVLTDARRYERPPNVNERLWQQAIDANPDPARLGK
jgi:hypothetical protein